MKKLLTYLVIVIVVISAGGYILYYFFLPDIVANAMLGEESQPYLPKRISNYLEPYREMVNEGTEEMLVTMEQNDISLEQILEALDQTTEAQVYTFIDSLKASNYKTPDDVFNVAKKSFPVDFDPEVFRSTFNEHVKVRLIKKGIVYATLNKKTKDVDFETIKAIARKILIEKEKEFRESLKQ
jgi:hypothetical protein